MRYKAALYVVMCSALFCATPTGRAQEVDRYVSGTLTSIDAGSISLQPPPRARGEVPGKESYKFDPVKLKILKADVGVGGVHTAVAAMADVRVGERVSVKHTNDVATELRILPPPQIQGTLVAIEAGFISVRVAVPAAAIPVAVDQRFSLDNERTQITSTSVTGGPVRRIGLSDLRIGQGVSVLANNGFAFVVRVLPAPLIIGTVSRMSASAIAIKVASRLPAATVAEREFQFDPHKLEVFHQYFGAGVQPGAIADLAVGNEVGITSQDGSAMAITINHPAVYGILSEVGPDFVTVTIKDGGKEVDRKFKIGDRTAIFIGVEDHNTKMPSGKTLHIWRFSPGGHTSDLRAGELASITAKGDDAISMRVRPAASQPK